MVKGTLEYWQELYPGSNIVAVDYGGPKCKHDHRVNLSKCDKCVIESLRVEIDRLQSWVNDLQSGMYINCVYCGHRYGPNTEVPASMADVLKEHIEQCPKHPLSSARAEIEQLQNDLAKCREARLAETIRDLPIIKALADVAREVAKDVTPENWCALQRAIENYDKDSETTKDTNNVEGEDSNSGPGAGGNAGDEDN